MEEPEYMKTISRKCPECTGQSLFTTNTGSGGHEGPRLLPGLGGFLHSATFQVVVCRDCGLTRFYAGDDALAKLPEAKQWQRM